MNTCTPADFIASHVTMLPARAKPDQLTLQKIQRQTQWLLSLTQPRTINQEKTNVVEHRNYNEDMDIETVVKELKQHGYEIPQSGGAMGHDGFARIEINGALYTCQQAQELLRKEIEKTPTR